jgi:hypothetical protein
MDSRVCSPCPHKDFVKPHPVSNAKSSMFMRVRRTLPQFTFILSERFVNRNSSVSTGFFRFFPVLFEFGYILPQKSQQNRQFWPPITLLIQTALALEKNIFNAKMTAPEISCFVCNHENHIRLAAQASIL